jgi:hypothetical protein
MPQSIALAATELPGRIETAASAESKQFGWILHPAIDMWLCCGGLVWVFFAVHYFLIVPTHNQALMQIMAVFAIIFTHCFSETHTVATLVRAYRTPETRRQYSIYTHWAALACVALGLVALFVHGLTPFFAKVYLVWVAQHFTAQTYGLVLLYCFKNDYVLQVFEKRVIWLVLNCTAVYAIVRQFSFHEWSANGFLGLEIPKLWQAPPWMFSAATVALVLSVIALVSIVLHKAIFERKVMPLPAVSMLATGVLIFAIGKDMAGILWLYVPALFHGSQYVVITAAHYLKQHHQAEGLPASDLFKLLRQSSGMRYLGFLIIGAIFLYVGIPRVLQEFGFDYTLCFATVFCVINLHHFLTDSAIWKLRDPKLRKTLV